MCNHEYIGNYAHMPRSMGQRCPYPELYVERLARGSEACPASVSPLPIDSRGVCIFHSSEIAWKRENGYQQRFLHLVELLDADDGQSYYDFAEFVSVGGGADSEGGNDRGVLRIENTTFRKAAYFTSASFLDSLELDRVDFQGGATFDQAIFARDLKVRNTTIRGLNLCGARLAGLVFFSNVQFLDHALFDDARFQGTTSGTVVRFEESRFEGITDFSGAVFTLGDESSVAFRQIRFEDVTNFQNTQFHCHLVFDEVSFGYVTEFVDTLFDSVGSSARYRGSAVELKRIEVPLDAVLTFKSTNPQNKMFTHDVQMSFKAEPAGTIRFDNVNFHKITSDSRLNLMRLAKLGIVEIGAGCIKYRYQTSVRTISVSGSNLPLVVELCQTFTSYFTQSNGLNLGFEIIERDRTKVSFFYFTDEDISEAAFLERLAQTERRLWNLLSVRSDRELLALEGAAGVQLADKESAIINAVDGISALLGTFFRVGARIALGIWKAADTQLLLDAIRFNDAGAEDRAANLHRVLVAKYTGRTLLGINKQQNELLLPMVGEESGTSRARKVHILFLGANSLTEPLEIEREVRLIQSNLKLARERDHLVFRQEWAVTIDTLTQAMLDESPNIVHFSGHGRETGIVLQDEMGKPRIVTADALASLFQLFTDTVRCVVLSSCYSEHQARAIRQHIPYVIGMSAEIPDSAAIAFATGFYQAIGAGREIPFAFSLGVAKIELEGVAGDNTPILL